MDWLAHRENEIRLDSRSRHRSLPEVDGAVVDESPIGGGLPWEWWLIKSFVIHSPPSSVIDVFLPEWRNKLPCCLPAN